ncbi:MAG: Uma2 family endonuclease [Ktedonobacteraceae bacterium]|nr:Uma2 family endonuclease [Ktedonobacteraceae bacterium]
MAVHKYPTIDVDDYLMLDQNSKNARYEYLDGELRMLAGGSNYHSAIISRLSSILERHLESTSCWVYNSDMKFKLCESRHVYPDVMVSCDQRDQEPEQTVIHYPTLVIEVLSPSTEATDRGEKLLYYQEYPTIQEYVMVDSQSIRIEVYHREEDGWKLYTYGPGSITKLESFDIQFPISTIYRGMKLTGMRKKEIKSDSLVI